MKLSKLILVLILLLAVILRCYQINSYPPLNADEAALGYNAYSLIKTGKDEHGDSWPIHFKSFGDYKPGGYIYLNIPFTYFFGLNPLSTRLPNLIISIISIFIFYLLVKELSKNTYLSLISALLLATSPWHIQFSRGAWESSVASSFTIFSTYFFIKNYKSKANLVLSAFFFAFSLYVYHSSRIITPLLVIALAIYYIKKINLKILIFYFFLIFILTLPVGLSFIKSGGTARFGGVGITADPGPIWRANELLNQHFHNNLFTRIIHNKVTTYFISWLDKYSSHFNANYLFFNGDEVQRSKVPNMGQVYLFLIPFFYYGLYKLSKSKQKEFKFITLVMLFIAPLPASLTFQSPSALRSLLMVYPLTIIASVGIYESIKKLNILVLPITFMFIFSMYYYLINYYLLYPQTYPFAWPYKFNELVSYLHENENQYQKVFITNRYDQPYILFLYFLKYDPNLIQKEISLSPKDKFGFSTVEKFDKYNFQKIKWETTPPRSLVVASDEYVPSNPIKIIDFPKGGEAFKIYSK